MKFGIVVFPGSNCEHDCYHIVRHLLGCEAEYLWHDRKDLAGAEALILPGGFAYGDYLRAGALARFSPVMGAVAQFARAGGPVIGICNGFQVLTEARLLPGALRVNRGLRYVCKDVHLRCERPGTAWTGDYEKGEVLRMPIGHMEGNYTAPPDVLEQLRREDRVVFRYASASGEITDGANPNGAEDNIAGICNREGNVVGLMPHPDRCSEEILGNAAGLKVFQSVGRWVADRRSAAAVGGMLGR
jgi:phosphoribosylformylglycinamidine synthase subunit PurQ / glutaminase